MLALNQIQGASAADFTFTDEGTLVTAVGGANSDVDTAPTRIIFDGAAGTTITAEAPVVFTDRAVSIGTPISSTFTLTAASSFVGNCLICSNSSLTLNNIILDVAPKAGVSAISVEAAAPVTVILNNVEVANVSGATAITVVGQAETTVTINNSDIHNNTAGAGATEGATGGSVIVVNAATDAIVTISGDTTITANTAGAGGAGVAQADGSPGGAGGSIVEVNVGANATVIIKETASITSNTSGVGGAGDVSDVIDPGGAGGAGGSTLAVVAVGDATVTISDTAAITCLLYTSDAADE